MCTESSVVRLLGIAGCLVALGGGCGRDDGSAAATSTLVITSHCALAGAGALSSGDSVSGDVHDESGAAAGSWTHDGAGGVLAASPDDIVCRINGSRVADVTGTGSYDGVPGHTFSLSVQDRGSPGGAMRLPGEPEPRTLVATRTYSPSRWTDATVTFAEGALVAVPASLPVTVGNAGNQWAHLTFVDHDSGDPIRCSYRGGASRSNPVSPDDVARGLEYRWARCERWNAAGRGAFERDATLVVGSVLDVDSIELHVQHGSSRFPSCDDAETTVTLTLSVTPLTSRPSEPDYYRLLVFGPTGDLVLFTDGDLASGDLTITALP